MSGFKPTPTGNPIADEIARKHGAEIAAERMSIKAIRQAFGVSDYMARRIKVACGLSAVDPKASRQRQRAKHKEATDGRERKGTSYELDTLAGEYVFQFPESRHSAPLRMSRDDVRALIMDYSNAGAGLTRAQLSARYALPRWQVVAILQTLDVVKAGVPFSEEDIAEAVEAGAVHSLEQRWLAATKQQVEARVARRVDAQLRKDAQKWRESQLYLLHWAQEASSSLAEAMQQGLPKLQPPTVTDGGECVLVLGLSDLHFGAYAWGKAAGARWDRDTCRKRLRSAIASILCHLPAGYQVGRIVLPIGSDMAHVDNANATTTKGTAQDMDGTPEQMVHELWELVHLLVLELAQLAPVDLWLMEANHDRILGHALFASLAVCFRDSERVAIKRDRSCPFGPYQVGAYGNTLLGFAHGDGRHKAADLASIMARQAREEWGQTEHRIWLTGHRHAHSVEENHGVEVHVLPSLAGTDRYHALKWPHRVQPRMKGLIIHEQDGLVCSLFGKPTV